MTQLLESLPVLPEEINQPTCVHHQYSTLALCSILFLLDNLPIEQKTEIFLNSIEKVLITVRKTMSKPNISGHKPYFIQHTYTQTHTYTCCRTVRVESAISNNLSDFFKSNLSYNSLVPGISPKTFSRFPGALRGFLQSSSLSSSSMFQSL